MLHQDLKDAAKSGQQAKAGEDSRKYRLFRQLVESRFQMLLGQMGPWTPEHKMYHSFGMHSQSDVDKEARLFLKAVANAFNLAGEKGKVGRLDNPLFWSLRNGFVHGDATGLAQELKYAFQSFTLRSRFSNAVTETHQKLADFRYPYEWFPATRAMQRTIHVHVGPTNSGKTYQALQALENSKTGIYAGPLRLLAHEIYTRFQAKGKPCALITGEEQRIPEGVDTYFTACTVEMAPLNRRVDVAVIDEIQMIANEDRGWAWTQAFLGVQAKEVHLCGEERTVELIKSLCARIGDKCIVHTYTRLSSLKTMKESLQGDFKNLRKGDAVVAFSRIGLHMLKAGIEEATGRRCAIVYGSLPPETRAQQAGLFNDPNNEYDFLVASDAIGMGLNLEIKRVIFEQAHKHDGVAYRILSVPEVKQIGGRAGRFRTAAQEIKGAAAAQSAAAAATTATTPPAAPPAKRWGTPGFVTTLEDEDLASVQTAFETEAPPIKTAGLYPPTFVIERFSSYFPPHTPLSFILLRLREMARLSSHFQLCRFDDMIEVADLIQPYPMSIFDRCVFLSAPVSLRDWGQRDVLRAFAECVSSLNGGHLLDIKEIDLEMLDRNRDDPELKDGQYLRRLESLHKAITLYLWLSYRYNGVFQSQDLAFHVKSLVEDKITDYLEHLTFVPGARQERQKIIRRMAEQRQNLEEKLLGDDQAKAGDTLPNHEGAGQWNEEGHEEPLAEDEEEIVLSSDAQSKKAHHILDQEPKKESSAQTG
ncbi:uncharacterized protein E0L32_008581 [Thyridium curvatum]|uniref:RNA helicase n=1 Tax=Thyridium curvatum TaxID=1093900 RepID=A0A507B091_9PEZI|nr:uncharacterized protein E0L32_008581 [Thyridium curvatum]TPX10531.1 hypothetical protein E0L32_008581 [Thyridium curvatum]